MTMISTINDIEGWKGHAGIDLVLHTSSPRNVPSGTPLKKFLSDLGIRLPTIPSDLELIRYALNAPAQPRLVTCIDYLQTLIDRAKALNPGYIPPSFKSYQSFHISLPGPLLEIFYRQQERAYLNSFADYLKVESQTLNISIDRTFLRLPPPLHPYFFSTVPSATTGHSRPHFLPSPNGLDINYAHSCPGGKGANSKKPNLQCADVEHGWDWKNNSDLHTPPIKTHPGITGENISVAAEHGTKVLGILVADDDHKRCLGIVPDLYSVNLFSVWRKSYFNPADAILCALTVLDPGDVLLIEYPESSCKNGTCYEAPAEIDPLSFNLIQLATKSGVIVVEAAGNRGIDLFDLGISKSSPDSGAILVAAAQPQETSPDVIWEKRYDSNYGERIDCFAHGYSIETTVPNDSLGQVGYISQTSAASAIIAGAALSLQSATAEKHNFLLRPEAVRSILSDGSTGQTSNNLFGVMPDLGKILPAILNKSSSDPFFHGKTLPP